MNTLSSALTVLVSALTFSASALEPRTWIVLDGRIIEGELQAVAGSLVTILDKDGRKVQLDKSFLTIGDNEYIRENFPDAKATGFSTAQAVQLPQPARTARIDQKAFKLAAGSFQMEAGSFDIMETPHFKVMYIKPTDPRNMGELAERMWFDAAYVHPSFVQKFATGQKMAIFLAPDDSTYDRIGNWYASLLATAGQQENANRVSASWPQSGSGSVMLTNDGTSKYGVFDHGRVFRMYRKTSAAPNARPEAIRELWTPFFVHCLAGDMISLQAPGVSEFGSKGYFALTGGHSYYKEVFLTGKSETGLLRSQSATGRDVSTARGLEDARQWAGELKKWVRKGEVKPSLENIYLLTREGTDVKGNVLAYGWARYLQNSIPKMQAFSKVVERISTSRQMPEPDDLAKIYGFAGAAEMDADFAKYLGSPEFR
jgi:hypothetical protein